MNFNITDKEVREATKKVLNGACEAADSLINTCDSRLTRNVLSGIVKAVEDAVGTELKTKTVLSSTTKKPAEVTHIEKETKQQEQETGSIHSSTTSETGDGQEKEEQSISTQKVSTISD